MAHIPVLLNEVIEKMDPQNGEVFVDGTLGNGGHAFEIAQRLGESGLLIGIDQDQGSLNRAQEKLADTKVKKIFIEGNFRHIKELIHEAGVDEVDGVLLDIGFSSEQIESSGRGFSFLKNEPLLMTFSATPKEGEFTAKGIVNDWDEENLIEIIKSYGEEGFAEKITKEIVKARNETEIQTTQDLVEIIRRAVPVWYTKKRIHFATKTFQALRIAVNDELGALKEGMTSSWEVLKNGGRLGIISFHSLEARLIKNFYKEKIKEGVATAVTKGALKAGRPEQVSNPRSRSAQLRVIKKI